MTSYFSDASFTFLRALARHNDKTWFNDHRHQYEAHVRQPFLQLITDLQPALAQVSPHYRADPKTQGGSLFRIYRDARFSNDKSPYKNWQGARLFHERRRQMPAPSFYLHLQPGESFVGAGLWHPEPDTQRKLRQFISITPAAGKPPRTIRSYCANSPWTTAKNWCVRRVDSPTISSSSTISSTATGRTCVTWTTAS